MQIQEPQRVGHSGPAAPDFQRNVFLPQAKFVSQSRIALGFFDWIEIGALQVFNQRELEHLQVVRGANYGGHRAQADLLRCTTPALPADQFKPRATLTDDERLNDSMLPNGIDQFLQCFAPKILSRL